MPNKPVVARYLKRYTQLPAVLSMLESRAITLLSPSGWEDKNDRVFMEQYARHTSTASVLGLCFTQAAETFHHWKVFAPGVAGVCVEFHKQGLLQQVPRIGYMHRAISYMNPIQLLASYDTPRDWPFIKGSAYRDEREYRIVYSSPAEVLLSNSFKLNLSCIRQIIVNPWLPEPLFEACKNALMRAAADHELRVSQSRVIDNKSWQEYAKRAA